MTLPRRRWYRFSLRTMFVMLTVFGCWLGYELNWISQRHAILSEASYPFLQGFVFPADQSLIMRICHEPPVDLVTAGAGLPESEFNRLKWLFPEANVGRDSSDLSREISVIATHREFNRARQLERPPSVPASSPPE